MAEFEKVVKLKVVSINDLASRNIIKLYADLETSLDTARTRACATLFAPLENPARHTRIAQRLHANRGTVIGP